MVKAINGIVKSNTSVISAANASDINAALGYTAENSSNKGVANGYAPLDAGSKVPTVNLGSGAASNTTFLRGDQTWGILTDPTVISLSDEFISGGLTNGYIGSMGWYASTGPTFVGPVPNHPGVRQLATTATIASMNALFPGTGATSDVIQPSEQWDFTFIFNVSSIAGTDVFVGALDSMSANISVQNRYGFNFNSSIGPYWRTNTGNGSASTETNTSTSVGAGTWYKLRVARTSSGVDFYVDGVKFGATVTTTLPVNVLNFGFWIKNVAGVAKPLEIDFFSGTLSGVTR